LLDEWKPDGPTEQDAVLSIAKASRSKCRLQRFLEIYFIQSTLDASHPCYDEATALTVFASVMAFDPQRAFEEMAPNTLRASLFNELRQKFPRSRFNTTQEWAQAIIDELKARLPADPMKTDPLGLLPLRPAAASLSLEKPWRSTNASKQ